MQAFFNKLVTSCNNTRLARVPARMPNIPAIVQEARTPKPVNKRVWREDKALTQRNLKLVRDNFDVKKPLSPVREQRLLKPALRAGSYLSKPPSSAASLGLALAGGMLLLATGATTLAGS